MPNFGERINKIESNQIKEYIISVAKKEKVSLNDFKSTSTEFNVMIGYEG